MNTKTCVGGEVGPVDAAAAYVSVVVHGAGFVTCVLGFMCCVNRAAGCVRMCTQRFAACRALAVCPAAVVGA